MRKIDYIVFGFFLSICLLLSIGCFMVALMERNGQFAIAGAIMGHAFMYCYLGAIGKPIRRPGDPAGGAAPGGPPPAGG